MDKNREGKFLTTNEPEVRRTSGSTNLRFERTKAQKERRIGDCYIREP
jgi:hypothetical protein